MLLLLVAWPIYWILNNRAYPSNKAWKSKKAAGQPHSRLNPYWKWMCLAVLAEFAYIAAIAIISGWIGKLF